MERVLFFEIIKMAVLAGIPDTWLSTDLSMRGGIT